MGFYFEKIHFSSFIRAFFWAYESGYEYSNSNNQLSRKQKKGLPIIDRPLILNIKLFSYLILISLLVLTVLFNAIEIL